MHGIGITRATESVEKATPLERPAGDRAITLFEARYDDYGTVRLEVWQDGLVVWIAGQIVWKTWESQQRATDELLTMLGRAVTCGPDWHRDACELLSQWGMNPLASAGRAVASDTNAFATEEHARKAAQREALKEAFQPQEVVLSFVYTNHKGKVLVRKCQPLRLFWGATEWHPTPGWRLVGFDLDKQAERTYDVRSIGRVSAVVAGTNEEVEATVDDMARSFADVVNPEPKLLALLLSRGLIR
jgi:hypothetical protein